MKTRSIIWGSLVLGIPIMVLAASLFYKHAIGYAPYREKAGIYLGPHESLRRELIEYSVAKVDAAEIATDQGVSLPADWSPKAAPVLSETVSCRFKAIRDGEPLEILVVEGTLEDLMFEEADSALLAEMAWGSWGGFKETFENEGAMLEEVAEQRLSDDILDPSPLWPLFPPPVDYRKRYALQAMKTFLFFGDEARYLGRKYDFYTMHGGSTGGGQVYVVDVTRGSFLGTLYVYGDAQVEGDAIAELCAALDGGTFAPPPLVDGVRRRVRLKGD